MYKSFLTERSIVECKKLPHYSVVRLDGIDRRCVKSVERGATTLDGEKQ